MTVLMFRVELRPALADNTGIMLNIKHSLLLTVTTISISTASFCATTQDSSQPEFQAPAIISTSKDTTAPVHGPRTVRADVSQAGKPLNDYFRRCVGSDHPIVGLRADFQRDLAAAHRECGFQYLRCHGVLSDDMGVYREDSLGRPVYDWLYVDSFYDFLHSIGMKPFVELSFMPAAITTGTSTVFYWKGRSSPPSDYVKWGRLVGEFAKHLTRRYGPEEVATWYFEVWNEPNLGFWRGTQMQYFQLFETAFRAIRDVNQDYRVGGPASAGPLWITDLLGYCVRRHLPISFISTHTYAIYSKNKEFDLPGTIVDHVKQAREEITSSPLKNAQLHVTEWGPSPSDRDVRHDSYRCAAFILNKVRRCSGLADSLSYWAVSDNFEERGPVSAPFHGGFGLMNFQGLRKPAFFAFKYLNQLGPEELESGDMDSYVTKDKNGNPRILFWDYSPAHEGNHGPAEWARNTPPAKVSPLLVDLAHLRPGSYRLQMHKTGFNVNDVYTRYIELGSPADLLPKQIETLQRATADVPELDQTVRVDSSGVFRCSFELRQNDCILLKLDRIDEAQAAKEGAATEKND